MKFQISPQTTPLWSCYKLYEAVEALSSLPDFQKSKKSFTIAVLKRGDRELIICVWYPVPMFTFTQLLIHVFHFAPA